MPGSDDGGNGKKRRERHGRTTNLMPGTYLGYLSHEDPLYGYLQSDILPQLGHSSVNTRYRVSRFDHSSNVYLYEEEHRNIRLVGKFARSLTPEQARNKGETEFNNLLHLRSIGFSAFPHYIQKPYGFNPGIDNVLITEFIPGEMLSAVFNNALFQNGRGRLFRKLSALAHFLATLHNRTATDNPVNFDDNYHYMEHLLRILIDKNRLGPGFAEPFWSLRETWRSRSCMWEDRQVLVHGDATPANFLLGRGNQVMAIDLERMKWSDRVFDLGRLCGELKHFFFRTTRNPLAAEPFIGHFLWEYCCHFPDRERTFFAVTRRLPFYMGITLLRIARNSWIDTDYRWRLINEAKQILKASP